MGRSLGQRQGRCGLVDLSCLSEPLPHPPSLFLPLIPTSSPFRVQHMDLSNSVFEVSTLQGILSLCSKLQNLSLEGLQLSDPIVK